MEATVSFSVTGWQIVHIAFLVGFGTTTGVVLSLSLFQLGAQYGLELASKTWFRKRATS